MSAGHRLESGPSALPSKALRAKLTPDIRSDVEKLAGAASVDRGHDIKWVGGRSEDGKTVYIDKDIPEKLHAGRAYSPSSTLPWHEIPEWYLMHELDLPYEDAHKLATHEFEKPRVESLGLDWRAYQEGWGGEISHNEKKHFGPEPKDLDRSPYLEGGKISAQEEAQVDPQDVSLVQPQTPDPSMAGASAPSYESANPQPNLLDQAHSQHSQLSAGYKKLTEAKAMLDKVRLSMDSLVSLGDMVSHEDVVKEAGKLVAAGMDPTSMAGILADMPPEGEALAAWVQQHDQDIVQREQQLEQVQGLVRHELGTSAMKLLSLAHLKEGLSGASLAGSLGPAPGALSGGSSPLPTDNALGAPSQSPDMTGTGMDTANGGGFNA